MSDRDKVERAATALRDGFTTQVIARNLASVNRPRVRFESRDIYGYLWWRVELADGRGSYTIGTLAEACDFAIYFASRRAE